MEVQDDSKEKQAWTVQNDPRVTPIGKFIRKTSLYVDDRQSVQIFGIWTGRDDVIVVWNKFCVHTGFFGNGNDYIVGILYCAAFLFFIHNGKWARLFIVIQRVVVVNA